MRENDDLGKALVRDVGDVVLANSADVTSGVSPVVANHHTATNPLNHETKSPYPHYCDNFTIMIIVM